MNAPSANEMYRAAQEYIDMGQPVFPCKVTGKTAKAPLGALVRNGVKDATLDKGQVKQWLRAQRTAALGLATGILWDVLDVDIKDGQDGRRHLHRLNHIGLLNGCQRLVRTPSGGYHLYFKAAPGRTNRAKGASIGLDMRGLGGYVLAPPSFLTNAENSEGLIYSGPYEDLGEPVGHNDEPLWWDLIVNDIQPTSTTNNEPIKLLASERRASVSALRGFVVELKHGERNNGFHWAVSRCVENGIDPHELVDAAIAIGLGEEEILKTCDSAMKRAGVAVEQLDSEAEALFPEA